MTIYFSENLRSLRKQRGLTQEDLAGFLGVSFQAVSKWERGESLPDITLLPEIAEFFSKTVDELLGINRAKTEKEINDKVNEYYNYVNDMEKKHALAKELIEKYPNDFRVQFLYMGDMILLTDESNLKENHPKVMSLYDSIQSFCVNDEIRIGSKNLLASFYNHISEYENSFVSKDDVIKIVDQLPKMRDCKEVNMKFVYIDDNEKRLHYSSELLDKELRFLFGDLWQHCFFDYFDKNGEYKQGKYSKEFIIEIFEATLAFVEKLYDDGHYGSMWRTICYNYGHLGHLYFEIGNNEKALENLRRAAILSKKYDELERFSTMKSKIFDGLEFDKDTLGSTYIASSRMYELMTEKYPLPEEFKSTTEFKEILSILS